MHCSQMANTNKRQTTILDVPAHKTTQCKSRCLTTQLSASQIQTNHNQLNASDVNKPQTRIQLRAQTQYNSTTYNTHRPNITSQPTSPNKKIPSKSTNGARTLHSITTTPVTTSQLKHTPIQPHKNAPLQIRHHMAIQQLNDVSYVNQNQSPTRNIITYTYQLPMQQSESVSTYRLQTHPSQHATRNQKPNSNLNKSISNQTTYNKQPKPKSAPKIPKLISNSYCYSWPYQNSTKHINKNNSVNKQNSKPTTVSSQLTKPKHSRNSPNPAQTLSASYRNITNSNAITLKIITINLQHKFSKMPIRSCINHQPNIVLRTPKSIRALKATQTAQHCYNSTHVSHMLHTELTKYLTVGLYLPTKATTSFQQHKLNHTNYLDNVNYTAKYTFTTTVPKVHHD
eukprot:gene3119-2101_t